MNIYLSLDYDQYKGLEKQLADYKSRETTHTSTPGPFYHKSIRLQVGDTTLEFHGPIVRAGGA